MFSRKPRGSLRRRAGITLVEVLVSTALLGMVFAGAFALITQASGMMRRTRNHYVATTLCLARLERAKDFDYNLLSFLEESDLVLNQDGIPDEAGYYRRHTEISTDTPLEGTTTIQVRVEVRNLKSQQFDGAFEEMTAAYTTYLTAPQP